MDTSTFLSGLTSSDSLIGSNDMGENSAQDIPSYLQSADNHNYGNYNQSWYDPATWVDKTGDAIIGAGKFAAASLLSGANSFYNTAAAVGSWAGLDLKQNDTGAWISSLDSNLGQYYQEHKESADLAGFVLTSLIPGVGGIKVLNAGQVALGAGKLGWIGANVAEGTGLMIPAAEVFAKTAAKELAESSAKFSFLNQNVLKSIGAGFGQQALEFAAFETAVSATMFKSPILEDKDFIDITKSIAHSALIGGTGGLALASGILDAGVLGGILGVAGIAGGAATAAKSYSIIKKEITAADLKNKIVTHITELPGVSFSDKVISRFEDLDTMKSTLKSGSIEVNDNTAKLAGDKESKLMNLARMDIHNITKGSDIELGNIVMNSLLGSDSLSVQGSLQNATEIARVGIKTDTEKLIDKSIKDLKVEGLKDVHIKYVGVSGADAGKMFDEIPAVLSIADTNKDPLKEVAKYKFGSTANKEYNFSEVKNHTEAEARYIWADKNKSFDFEKNTIAHNDIPLLEKAYFDNVPAKVKSVDGSIIDLTTSLEKLEYIQGAKNNLIKELQGKKITITAYHGTTSDFTKYEIPKGHLGVHLGTIEQAKKFAVGEGSNIRKESLTFNKTLTLPDGGWENSSLMENKLQAAGIIAKDDFSISTKLFNREITEAEAMTKIKNKILSKGYDSVSYSNKFEGDGTSYISLVPEKQISVKQTKERVLTNPEIAKITNTKLSYIEGVQDTTVNSDIFARQDYQKQYIETLKSRGVGEAQLKGLEDTSTIPSYFKVAYNTAGSDLKSVDGNVLSGMSLIKQKQKLNQQDRDNIFANSVGNSATSFPSIDESLILDSNRYGSAPGRLSFNNGNYGTLSSTAQFLGQSTAKLIQDFTSTTSNNLQSYAYKLANNPEAAIEFMAINNKISSTGEQYVLSSEGNSLIPAKLKKYYEALESGNSIPEPRFLEGVPLDIPIKSDITLESIEAHIAESSKNLSATQEIRNVQGYTDDKILDAFRVIRPDPKEFTHFALVVDPKVSGVGHISMLHAASQKELDSLISKVPSQFKTLTDAQSKEFHQAMGDYKYSRTLHENYIDSSLAASGVNTPFYQKTDPNEIAKDFLNHHVNRSAVLARDLVSMKYEKEFTELQRLDEQFTGVSKSKYSNYDAFVEDTTNGPYSSYIKTALNISQTSDTPALKGFNQILDRKFTEAMRTVSSIFSSTKSPRDLSKLDEYLQEVGANTAYRGSAEEMYKLVNHSAPQGALREFVKSANAILSNTLLGLDPMNAVTNTVGHSVLLSAETNSIIRAIKQGDSRVAGKLSELGMTKVPGTEDMILSPTKLIANSIKNFTTAKSDINSEAAKNSALYKANGWITDHTEQFKQTLDDLTLAGSESSSILSAKLESAFNRVKSFAAIGRKYSGNNLAEEFNRYIAADVMKQITDLGIEAGVITAKEQPAYINTFVNRTQGVTLASQRPLAFQGPVGQAIGLFQTYQFNLMQQLFRYVGEGSSKDAAMLLGMQSTVFGLNGLPAFNYINQSIVGNASDNPGHKDIHSAVYGAAGKDAADWLMYGFPSNILHANMYSRGDINPRQITVIPADLSSIPIVSAGVKFFGNLKETASKIQGGGDVWQSFLQGLEHNSVSRPLAGIAQTLQAASGGRAISTSNVGNISGANDLFSLSTLARLSGAKPFDESITNDYVYRIAAYESVDAKRKSALDESIKSTLIVGGEPSSDQIEKFTERFVALGGKQKDFNKHIMKLYKNANTSQANKIASDLNSPFSQSMQTIMGGTRVLDGTDLY